MTQSDTRNMEWERILALELESVRKRLWGKRGLLWKIKNDSLRLEKEYRQFLYLIVRNPGVTIVPWSQGLDDFWHEHILDTAKYAADCEYLGTDSSIIIRTFPNSPKDIKRHTRKPASSTAKPSRKRSPANQARTPPDPAAIPACPWRFAPARRATPPATTAAEVMAEDMEVMVVAGTAVGDMGGIEGFPLTAPPSVSPAHNKSTSSAHRIPLAGCRWLRGR